MIVFVLLMSAMVGLYLGASRFPWLAIAISGLMFAVGFAVLLYKEGFSSFAGITSIVVCLTVNQAAYLMGIYLTKRRVNDG